MKYLTSTCDMYTQRSCIQTYKTLCYGLLQDITGILDTEYNNRVNFLNQPSPSQDSSDQSFHRYYYQGGGE
jgi:hypothetical protein